ncbi:MAG: AEC family transporter [Solirubrobacteraceae bacterium]
MLWVALTIVAAIAVGVEAERRKGPRAGRAARGVLWLMLYVLMPPVVFFNIARLEITADVGAGIALGWAALALSALTAWGVGRRLLRLERPSAGVLSIVAMQGNTGILGLPFVAAVLGFDRLPEAVAYDALVQAPVFLLLSFAVAAATGTRAGEGVRQRVRAFFFRNPPLAAVALALVAPDALAPDVLVDASRVLVLAMVPLGFFAVGVTMAEEAEEGALRFPPPFTRGVGAALVLRLCVAPLLLLALAAPLIDLPGTFLLLAAMPAGLHIVMLAHAYGLDLPFAAGAIVWTTAVWMVLATGVIIVV